MSSIKKFKILGMLCFCISFCFSQAVADPIPEGWQALNMESIGFMDYQDRYSGKFTIKEQDGRWYLYMAFSNTLDRKTPPAIGLIQADESTTRLNPD